MPFTFSHPAAVVPFTRYGLPFSALVIGSMLPDFETFLYLSSDVWFAHTALGIFQFCLPVGLIVLWIFHRVLKFPLLSLLPVSHQQRLLPLACMFRFFSIQGIREQESLVRRGKQFILILLSLLVGAFTHITWDALTHGSGWIVRQFPFLSLSIPFTSDYSVRVYKILQHGSTLAGAILLVYWYFQWFRRAPLYPIKLSEKEQLPVKTKIGFILLAGIGTSVLASVYGILSTSEFSGMRWFLMFIRNAVISGIPILFIILLLFSQYWHLFIAKSFYYK